MPSLAEHWSEGNFLEVGEHVVTIASTRLFAYNSGSQGVEFKLRGNHGKEGKVSFCLQETILWRLAQFAEACGFTKDECRDYNTDNPDSHNRLLNRQVLVTVEKTVSANGKEYAEVVAWQKPENGTTPAPAPAAQKPTPPAPTQPDDSKTKDDLPF